MNEQQRVEPQPIRELIAGAGPRAAPPAGEVATIKEAAREEWRQMVAGERRRRHRSRLRGGLALAAGMILAVVVGWWWNARPLPVTAPVVASVELLNGAVRTGDGVELSLGGELTAGTLVETAGWQEGRRAGVALRLGGGQSLRLAADSGVRLLSERSFELRRGTLYLDSDTAAEGGGVEVVTVLGTVRDIGTQFEVRVSEGDAALRVRVREGQVALEAEGGRHLASPGDQLNLMGDGSIARARVETYGPEWDWVLATAPSIEFDGRTVADVVRWFGREMGRSIRYAEPQLGTVAEGAVMSGSSAGFTPEQTLEWALRSNAMRYQIENGTILITR